MLNKTRFIFLPAIVICTLVTAAFASLAFAEEFPRAEISDAPGLVPNYGYTMSFVRTEEMAYNEATLRIVQPIAVSGCMDISTPEAQTSIIGPSVKVVISPPVVKFDDSPKYGNSTCRKKSPSVTTDVILNRDELIKGDVSKIVLSGPGGEDTYDLHADKDKIYFFRKVKDSERQMDLRVDFFDDKYFFKPTDSKARHAPLTHWFYPENVVMLNVVSAPGSGLMVAYEIEKLATRQGFIRLRMLLKGFEPPSTDKNTLYFVDQTGITAKSLSHDLGAVFGTITVSETFHGPEGPYEQPKKLDVFAKLPGMFE